jgi:hypothetical protein
VVTTEGVTYSRASGEATSDVFTYTVASGGMESNTATVTISLEMGDDTAADDTDEAETDEAETDIEDRDGDGYTEGEDDCDDDDRDVHPGAEEIQNDARDQDCDGRDKEIGLRGAGCRTSPSPSTWIVGFTGLALAGRRRRAS